MIHTPSSSVSFRLKFRPQAKTPRFIRAMRRKNSIQRKPYIAHDSTLFMIGELVQWWIEAEDDETPHPEAWDVAKIFRGADVDLLRRLLRHASNPQIRAACAAALGALEIHDALFDLVEARHDPHVEVRQFAWWAIGVMDFDDWHGAWNLWDMLYQVLPLLDDLAPTRQLRMF